LLFPSKWCFSKICFFCLPQAEKAEISKHDIFLMTGEGFEDRSDTDTFKHRAEALSCRNKYAIDTSCNTRMRYTYKTRRRKHKRMRDSLHVRTKSRHPQTIGLSSRWQRTRLLYVGREKGRSCRVEGDLRQRICRVGRIGVSRIPI
jgi:hypothetical protein